MASALTTSLSSHIGQITSKQEGKSQEKTQSTKHFVNPARNEKIVRPDLSQLELFDIKDLD